MNIINQVKERLSIFNTLYDNIRIIDPVNKTTTIITDDEVEELKGTCYGLWKSNKLCENCISMRANINDDTFVKIEYDRGKIILITATPIEVDGKKYIVEILKDITQNGSILHKLTEDSNTVEELISSINEKIVKDDLTGVYNRRYINERLPVDINYSRISKMPLSIIMVDIDYFKNINDKYGHIIGDKVLIDFANLIQKSITINSDWVGRFGGEEFVIVLNNTDLKKAYIIAEKIRMKLENMTLNYDGTNINITASFGVYSITDHDSDISDLLSKADKNLYKAKAGGRNRTSINQENIDEVMIKNIDHKSIRIRELDKQIKEAKQILDEACYNLDSSENKTDPLIISQHLDELIVEYMKEMYNLK